MDQNRKRIPPVFAQFTPQAWSEGRLEPVDTECPEDVDISKKLLAMSAVQVAALESSQKRSDLVDPVERGHWGPCRVTCNIWTLRSFFGVRNLGEVTEALLTGLRDSYVAQPTS